MEVKNIFELPILKFASELSENEIAEEKPDVVSWQDFYTTRNLVLQVCRKFGSVGPMGECIITEEGDEPSDPWPVEDENPQFFVVEKWDHDGQRFIRVETDPPFITIHFLVDMIAMLSTLPDHWGVGVAIGDGYLMIFADKIMIEGPRLESCSDVRSLLDVCRHK